MLNKYHFFAFLITAFLLGCSNQYFFVEEPKITEKIVEATEKVDVQIVLLAGQSNMAGAGNYDALDEGVKARIMAVSNRVMVARSAQIQDTYPLSYYANTRSEKYNFDRRFGPELLIGLTLAENNPAQRYLLIKKSLGGASLYGAWNPDWTVEQAQAIEKPNAQNIPLYNDHLTSIRQHLYRLRREGQSYKIISLVWMQGESDAAEEISAITYAANLNRLIEKYRTDLNAPHLSFVVGQINSQPSDFKLGLPLVRKAIADVTNTDQKAAMIPTTGAAPYSDFPKYSDNVHYNVEGQRRLGIAFGEAILSLN